MAMRTGNMLIDESETKKPVAHNPLEQFILLAKGTKGAACQDLIKTVLEAPGVYVFSELLEHPNIREVSTVVDDSLNYSWKIVRKSIHSLCFWSFAARKYATRQLSELT